MCQSTASTKAITKEFYFPVHKMTLFSKKNRESDSVKYSGRVLSGERIEANTARVVFESIVDSSSERRRGGRRRRSSSSWNHWSIREWRGKRSEIRHFRDRHCFSWMEKVKVKKRRTLETEREKSARARMVKEKKRIKERERRGGRKCRQRNPIQTV